MVGWGEQCTRGVRIVRKRARTKLPRRLHRCHANHGRPKWGEKAIIRFSSAWAALSLAVAADREARGAADGLADRDPSRSGADAVPAALQVAVWQQSRRSPEQSVDK